MRFITSSEFGESIAARYSCILPVGAYEQHGPHCVLETDCITAGYIAEQIGKLLDVPVLPTIPFGRSVIHRDFPGTIYITDETYEHYLRDVFSAIRENAIQYLFIINGHGGNGPVLDRAIEMEHSDRFKIALFNWFEYIDDTLFLKESRSHAGGMETSVIEAIDAHNVRNHLVENGDRVTGFRGRIQNSIKECTTNGVIGIATNHSPAKGIACINMCCAKICGEIYRKWGLSNG